MPAPKFNRWLSRYAWTIYFVGMLLMVIGFGSASSSTVKTQLIVPGLGFVLFVVALCFLEIERRLSRLEANNSLSRDVEGPRA
jgi:membrane-bound acyltransferase YfiQ involved in biofilm formation